MIQKNLKIIKIKNNNLVIIIGSITLFKVLNKYKNTITKEDVYIGRPSKWGNPFVIGKDGTRDDVVDKYREWLLSNPTKIKQAIEELKGKNLVCFCAPCRCHGDILLEIANKQLSISNGYNK